MYIHITYMHIYIYIYHIHTYIFYVHTYSTRTYTHAYMRMYMYIYYTNTRIHTYIYYVHTYTHTHTHTHITNINKADSKVKVTNTLMPWLSFCFRFTYGICVSDRRSHHSHLYLSICRTAAPRRASRRSIVSCVHNQVTGYFTSASVANPLPCRYFLCIQRDGNRWVWDRDGRACRP